MRFQLFPRHSASRFSALLICAIIAGCTPAALADQPTAIETQSPAQSTSTDAPSPQPTPEPTSSPTQQPAGLAGQRSIGDAYISEIGNTGYDVQAYTLRFAIDPAEVYVAAHTTIEALSTLQDLGQISIDFIGFRIDELNVNGEPAQYEREGDKLVVNFATPLDDGQAFSIDIAYSGMPLFESSPYLPFIDHLGIFFNADTRRAFALAEPDGARYWFPCNDHPRDKATYRIELTVPEELTGVANGQLVETHTEVPNALASGAAGDQFIWEHAYPMATYLATIGIGEYVLIEGVSPRGVPLRSYAYPELQAAYTELMPQVGEMLDWMSDRFGEYPFEAFGYYSVEGVGVSLETQTMVALGDPSVYTMAHEMAHMWFGDWVSLDSWTDMWRNEGFATYIGTWAVNGVPPDTQEWKDAVESSPMPFPLNQPAKGELFGRDSYLKGALLVEALRDEMGAQAFLDGLRLYFERYGGGTATHEQFQAALEEAAGKSLEPVFEAWFAPVGIPVE